jgi:hypothetical protein
MLAAVGLLLLALCAFALIRRQDAVAGGLAVLGLGALVLGVLAPRLTGPVEMGLSGFKLQLVENLTTTGEAAGYSDEDILEAIKRALSDRETPTAPPAIRTGDDRLVSDEPLARPDESELGALKSVDLAREALRRFEAEPSPLGEPSLSDLYEGIHRLHQAIALLPTTSPMRPSVHLMLADALIRRYEVSGEVDDIEQAMSLIHQALAAIPEDHPMRESALQLLAKVSQLRYAATGEIANQAEAMEALRLLDEARRRKDSIE